MYYGEKRVENPIRWAMVGGGKGSQIGYIHRSAALRDFNFELVAGAFDIDPERGRAFGASLHVAPERCYPDYKSMFEAEAKRPDGIQAVSIATPNFTHFEIAKAALEAGLHVYLEKPMCFTTAQAEELDKQYPDASYHRGYFSVAGQIGLRASAGDFHITEPARRDLICQFLYNYLHLDTSPVLNHPKA